MAQLRTLGGVVPSSLQNRIIRYWYFSVLEMPSPLGNLYYTQKPDGYTGVIGNLGSQTWTPMDFRLSGIAQGREDLLSASAIEFPNGDGTFTDWFHLYGFRGRVCSIYLGWFYPDGTLEGSFRLYKGKIDENEITLWARMSLESSGQYWEKKIPPFKMGPLCINPYKDTYTCRYAGAEPGTEVTCYKTRKNCSDRGNLINFNGFDMLPPEGTEISWG